MTTETLLITAVTTLCGVVTFMFRLEQVHHQENKAALRAALESIRICMARRAALEIRVAVLEAISLKSDELAQRAMVKLEVAADIAAAKVRNAAISAVQKLSTDTNKDMGGG